MRSRALLLLWLIAGHAGAAEFEAEAALYGEQQSNILSANRNEQNGGFGRATIDVLGSDVGERHGWSMSGNFNYQHYVNQTLDERFFADAVANLYYAVLPTSLLWHLDYNESQELIDIGGPGNIDNQRSVRVFGTGPVLQKTFARTTHVTLSARRQRVDNEQQVFHRNIASISLRRDIRPRHQSFIEASHIGSDFDQGQADFSIREAQLGYLYSRQRTQLRLAAGNSWLDRDGLPVSQQETGSLRLRLSLPGERRLEALAEIRFADDATTLQPVGALETESDVESVGAFREDQLTLTYSGSERAGDPALRVFSRERRHQESSFTDRDARITGGTLSTRLYSGDSGFVSLLGSASHNRFLTLDRLDKDVALSLEGTRLLNARHSVTVGGGYFQRDSSIDSSSFDNRTLFVEYRGKL